MTSPRAHLEWTTPVGVLLALEPTDAELAPHVPALVAAYNDPQNAASLGHTEPLDEVDVVAHYTRLRATGDRPVLFFVDGALAGDGDLRGIADGVCELAFLIAAPGQQGKGLGTRFALMLHALAFGPLALARVYASVLPANTASLRVFEKLGYQRDDSVAARAVGDAGDVVLSVDRSALCARHGSAMAEIRAAMR